MFVHVHYTDRSYWCLTTCNLTLHHSFSFSPRSSGSGSGPSQPAWHEYEVCSINEKLERSLTTHFDAQLSVGLPNVLSDMISLNSGSFGGVYVYQPGVSFLCPQESDDDDLYDLPPPGELMVSQVNYYSYS